MKLKLVIFDMDGLMFDTEPIGEKCLKQAAKEFGYDIKPEFHQQLIGINIHDHNLKVKAEFGEDYPTSEILALAKEIKMAYFYEYGLPIKLGLKELITYLKSVGIKIAVASSSSGDLINEYLKLAKMENVFDYIISGDKVLHSKPNPEIFLKAVAHFGFNNEEALVLEDSTNGILASHNAKIPVICIPDMVENGPEILALTYKVLPSLNDVINVVKEELL